MLVLRLLMGFSIITICICVAAAIVVAQTPGNACYYYGMPVDNKLIFFVPSVTLAFVYLIIMGFTANLHCYHTWLRKNNITTLEHILKYKSATKINKILPFPSATKDETPNKEIQRIPLRKPLSLKSNQEESSLKSSEMILSSENRTYNQKSFNQEGFTLGRPKSKFEKAEEYFRQSEKAKSKLTSESSVGLTGREPPVINSISNCIDNQKSPNKNLSKTSFLQKSFAKPMVSGISNSIPDKESQEDKTVVKKTIKKKLPPISTEDSIHNHPKV